MKAALVLFAMLLILSVATCAPCRDTDHMGGWNRMMGYGGGMLMWLLFLVLIAVVVYLVIQSQKSKTHDRGPRETALDILKKRFARGEIGKEEYEEKKETLRG